MFSKKPNFGNFGNLIGMSPRKQTACRRDSRALDAVLIKFYGYL